MFYGGEDAYFKSGWNIMDGALVVISIIDLLMSLISESSPRIFGILRVRLYKMDSIILTNILVVHLLNDWKMRERASNHLPLTVKKIFTGNKLWNQNNLILILWTKSVYCYKICSLHFIFHKGMDCNMLMSKVG